MKDQTGVIFDFNGTMVFDKEYHEIAWREYLEKEIGRPITDKEFQENVHGVNCQSTLEHFFNRPVSREEAAEREEGKEKIYRDLCRDNPDYKLVEGLSKFLDQLKEQNIPMTIASASNIHNIKFFIEQFDLKNWFDPEKIVYNDGVIARKPNPDFFLKSAENIEVDPKNCIIFEDSVSGIQAAKRAGAKRIVGITAMLDEDTMRRYGATDIIDDYSKIYELNLFENE